MQETYLGEFQEIVMLAILVLDDNAYGVSIQKELKQRLNRDCSRGALHTALTRLQEKGLISSEMGGASAVRGGRRKRYYTVTNKGKVTLKAAKDSRDVMWKAIPNFSLKTV
ncbi:MAG: helix-turn-helix transcriptional regulator [Saprospiraceae bacterium]|nr:helix-turn-helix transcriptional regulator [Saprospiraceae bacterium]